MATFNKPEGNQVTHQLQVTMFISHHEMCHYSHVCQAPTISTLLLGANLTKKGTSPTGGGTTPKGGDASPT